MLTEFSQMAPIKATGDPSFCHGCNKAKGQGLTFNRNYWQDAAFKISISLFPSQRILLLLKYLLNGSRAPWPWASQLSLCLLSLQRIYPPGLPSWTHTPSIPQGPGRRGQCLVHWWRTSGLFFRTEFLADYTCLLLLDFLIVLSDKRMSYIIL